MKKLRLFLFVILCLQGFSVQSQNVGAGLSLGPIFSQLDGDSFGGYKKIGLHFGGYSWYDFSDRIALQIEILYQQKGSRETVNGYYRQSFHYIDVPVLARFLALGDTDKGLFLHAGLAPGFLISSQVGFRNTKTDDTSKWNRFSTDALADVEYKINSKLSFMMRFGISLINILPYRFNWHTNRYFNLALRVGLK